MTRYIEWDFEHNMATEYERRGECNYCGACCTGALHYNFQRKDAAEQFDMRARGGGKWVNGKGVWQEIQDGDIRIFRQFVSHEANGRHCEHLRGDRCAIYNQAPMICKLWPIAPCEAALFERCSYSFVRVADWQIGTG